MDRIDPNERTDKDVRKNDAEFCPKCATALHAFIDVLDSRNGQVFRLFRCACGEFFWNR